MIASFSVEAEKLLKRPASWVLCGILAVSAVLFIYVLGYSLGHALGDGGAGSFGDLRPTSVPSNAASQLSSIGIPVALTLGVLVMGSEYRWDTIKGSVVSPSGRAGFIVGKLLTLGAFAAVLSATVLLVCLCSSLVLSSLLDLSRRPPSVAAFAGTFCVGWLVLLAYSALGFCLTVAVRSSGRAIAASLVYVLIFEPIVAGILGATQSLRRTAAMLPGQAVNNLITAMDAPSTAPSPGLSDPAGAALVLIFWVAFFGLVSLVVFARREVR